MKLFTGARGVVQLGRLHVSGAISGAHEHLPARCHTSSQTSPHSAQREVQVGHSEGRYDVLQQSIKKQVSTYGFIPGSESQP